MDTFSHKNLSPTMASNKRISNRVGFTVIEIVCIVSIFLIIAAGILKIYQCFQVRDKLAWTRTEMVQIVSWLEEYRKIHGDYPKVAAYDDNQGAILCSALHGRIDPMGNTPDEANRIDFVTTSIKEIDGKFVDPFLSDYIYYYRQRGDTVWQNPSFILISKGSKGQQNSQRNRTIPKGVTINPLGRISSDLNGDIVSTCGGFW